MKDGKIYKFQNVFYSVVNGVIVMKARLNWSWSVSGINAKPAQDVKFFIHHVELKGELVNA